MNAYFEPIKHSNSFIEINQDALTSLGFKVHKLNKMLSLKDAWLKRHSSIIVLNWAEDQMYRKGITKLQAFKLFLRYVIFIVMSLFLCSKRIWIKHNFKPHNSSGNLFYFKALSFLLKFFKFKEVFLETYIGSNHIPHPLYLGDSELESRIASCRESNKNTSVKVLFFGSVKAYKGLDRVLKNWPVNLQLKILGKSDSQEYKKELENIISERAIDVTWHDTYVPDEQLAEELSTADFVLLPHEDGAMVSSGSFYHAISYGCKILASPSAFARHKAKEHEFVFIVDFESLKQEEITKISLNKTQVLQDAYKVYNRQQLVKAWRAII